MENIDQFQPLLSCCFQVILVNFTITGSGLLSHEK